MIEELLVAGFNLHSTSVGELRGEEGFEWDKSSETYFIGNRSYGATMEHLTCLLVHQSDA